MALGSMSGKNSVLMDQRGRISFPTSIRADIGDVLFISTDQRSRHFLVVRSEADFNAELDRIRERCIAQNADFLDPDELQDEIDDALRDFASFTQKTSPDKNGRITIDSDLVKYAGLEGRVIVNGVGTYAEIWNEDKFNAKAAEYDDKKERRRAKIEAAKKARREAEAAKPES